jgi:glycosyltransferase involved in cell wall biosynthesis
MCVNADAVAVVRRRLGRGFFRKRPVAGLWFWEVEKFPAKLHHAFEEVDEVWVATEFVRRTLAPISPVPVHLIPLPFGVTETTGPLDCRAAGIPDGYFFLFSFDFHSIFRRKNPLGLVEAFKLAFREGEGPSLVIKGINGEAHLEELEQLRCAARDRKDIIILSGYMDASVNQSLMAACDCYVSLHRSEGLGLTMAEAMMQKKPVIATNYSGNVDFMNEQNSYLCRYTMQPVGADAAPYCPDAMWAEPDIRHAAQLMRQVYEHPAEAAEKGRLAAKELGERFSPERCAAAIEARWHGLRSVQVPESRDAMLEDLNTRGFSVPVKNLRKQMARPLDVSKTVPSLGTMILQGPRAVLKKMLIRIERYRKSFDEASVKATSDHDQRLAALEQAQAELREQHAALLRAQAEGRVLPAEIRQPRSEGA